MSVFNDINYVSTLSTDYRQTVTALEKVGLVETWRGRHAHYGVGAAILASRSGGIMVLDALDQNANPIFTDLVTARSYLSRPERWFHIALAVRDVLEVHHQFSSARGSGGPSPIVGGELGQSFLMDIPLDRRGNVLHVEIGTAQEAPMTSPESSLRRLESVGIISSARRVPVEMLVDLGATLDVAVSAAEFPELSSINSLVWCGARYLEVNTPTDAIGTMASLLSRIGGGGIFGVGFEPIQMDEFVDRAHRMGIGMNTPSPVVLRAKLGRETLNAARVLTINPAWTGGARLFVLDPLDYPVRRSTE